MDSTFFRISFGFLFVAALVLTGCTSPESDVSTGPDPAVSRPLYGIHTYRAGAEILFSGKGGYCVEYIPESNRTSIRNEFTTVQDIVDAGLTVILRIDYRLGQTMPVLQTELDEYAAECAAIARLYRDQVNIFVLANEMNFDYEGELTSDDYAAGYKYIRAAIKAENPDAIVLVGPVGPWYPTNPDLPEDQEHDFYSYRAYQEAIVTKIGDDCDGYAIHAYGCRGGDTDPRDDGEDSFGVFQAQIERINAAVPSARNKPIYITEFNHAADGYQDEVTGSGTVHVPLHEYPAGFLYKAYQAVQDWNEENNYQVKALCWFTFKGSQDWSDWGPFSIEMNTPIQRDFKAMSEAEDWIAPAPDLES